METELGLKRKILKRIILLSTLIIEIFILIFMGSDMFGSNVFFEIYDIIIIMVFTPTTLVVISAIILCGALSLATSKLMLVKND